MRQDSVSARILSTSPSRPGSLKRDQKHVTKRTGGWTLCSIHQSKKTAWCVNYTSRKSISTSPRTFVVASTCFSCGFANPLPRIPLQQSSQPPSGSRDSQSHDPEAKLASRDSDCCSYRPVATNLSPSSNATTGDLGVCRCHLGVCRCPGRLLARRRCFLVSFPRGFAQTRTGQVQCWQDLHAC